MNDNYWTSRLGRRGITRRRVVAGTALGGAGLASLALVGCGDDDDDNGGENTPAAGSPSAAASGTPSSTPTQAAATPKKGGTLNLSWNSSDTHLDPHQTIEHLGPDLWRAVSHGLLKQEARTETPRPDLATGWEIPEPTTYVFKLDQRAKWSSQAPVSGRAVTAEDVVYSLKRISTSAPGFVRAGNYTAIESIDAPDASTVRVKLKAPFAPILAALSDKYAVVVAPEVVEKHGDLKKPEALIGCGPFIAENVDTSKSVTLARNPAYWNSALPYLDKVVYTIIKDDEAWQAAFRSGQTDATLQALPFLNLDGFKDSKTTLVEFDQVWFIVSLVGGPNSKAPTSDPRVRQAINLAVDRQMLGEVLYPGGKVRPMGVYENTFWGISPDEAAKVPGYGSKKTDQEIKDAKALISAAGIEGQEIVIDTTKQYGAVFFDAATAVVSMLEKIGLKAKLNVLEFAVMREREKKKEQQLSVGSMAAYGDPDPQLYNVFHSKGTRNNWSFSDPVYDQMVEKQRAELNLEARLKLVKEIQLYLMKGTPVAPYAIDHKTVIGVRNKVKNFKGTPIAGSSCTGWFLPEVWLDA